MRLGKVQVKVGSLYFKYPVPQSGVKNKVIIDQWNKQAKDGIDECKQSLNVFKRTLCDMGLHSKTHKREYYAWVLEDEAWYCKRCATCLGIDHHWHSD